ncbi:uncharacterized protein PAF06_016570, partial [Gastrophryne carolinensis]
IRQCGPSSLCSKTGSMSLPSGRFKSSVTCCDTDDCTPPDPILPEYSGDEEKKNGIRCPSCYVTNSKSCDLITVMDCIGNETMCMTQITDTEGPVPSTTMSRGCSTQGLCEPAQQVWKLGKMVVNVENACYHLFSDRKLFGLGDLGCETPVNVLLPSPGPLGLGWGLEVTALFGVPV